MDRLVFDNEVESRENTNTLEIVKCRFMDSVYTDAIELLQVLLNFLEVIFG